MLALQQLLLLAIAASSNALAALHARRFDLAAWGRQRTGQPRAVVAGGVAGGVGAAAGKFDVETAVLLAGFAFEAYNEPSESDARWERGADGTHVAFISDEFAAECYQGRLEVCLQEVRGLPPPKQLNLNDAASFFTGSNADPYVIFALNEELGDGPKEGAVALQRATDVSRTTTRWSSEAPKVWF